MKTTRFNSNWKFWEITNSFALNWAPPEDAVTVSLPHDAMIEHPQDPNAPAGANTGYRKGGVYSYSKTLSVSDPGKTYILKVEGAYMNAFVYVNGTLAAKRPFGYTVFYVPLNPYLSFVRENEIRIQVRSGAEPNSRWYPGTGLYRDVYLLEGNAQYIKPDSVQIRTVKLPQEGLPGAKIHIRALTASRTNEAPGSVEITISDAAGQVVATHLVPVNTVPVTDDSATAKVTDPLMQSPDPAADAAYYPAEAELTIPRPYLWDADEPNLYTCSLALKALNGTVMDTHSDTFGIRMLSLSPQEGFRINGKEVKLRGTCIHHDSGMLGAKTFEEVHIRQIQKLKESGFNAIRCAHNPAAPALLRACDKVGMYVMDESFDIWTRHKSDYDYGMYFSEWWEADIEAMVRNSFNHPSVIMYSIGNEIPEIGTAQGGRISRMICEKIKSIDETRFTLASVNGMFSVGDALGQIVSDVASDLAAQGRMDGNVNDFMAFMHAYMNDMTSHPIVDQTISVPFQYTDIAGYNYMGSRYDLDGTLHPERVIVGSETGIGDLAYNWERVLKYPYLIGDFCWTGWEYLGEAGIGSPNYSNGSNPFGNAQFPLQISGTGCIDITGHRLPMSYYREIVFGLRKDPYIAVQDPAHYGENLIRNPWIISDAIGSWSWSRYDGKPVVLEVYADAQEVEVFKNDVSLGKKAVGAETPYMAFFETTWEPGTLTAVAYREGMETGRFTIRSADEDLSLHIEAEPLYSTDLPIFEHEAAQPEQKEDIFASFNQYFAAKDPMQDAGMPSPKQMMAEYEASAIKSRELTEQLKEAYLNGNYGKPELVLDIRQSNLFQVNTPQAETAASEPPAAEPAAAEPQFPSDAASENAAAAPEEPVVTPETPYHIHFLNITLSDACGNAAADRDMELELSVEGDAQVLAFGSADPYPSRNYNEFTAKTYQGRAQLILKKEVDTQPVQITVTSGEDFTCSLEI